MGACCCSCIRDRYKLPYSSIFDITHNNINGVPTKLSVFKNKVLVIVNVASA